jgi:PAS domain S-box-containing protein
MGTDELKILAIDDDRDTLATLQAIASHSLPRSSVLAAPDGPRGLEIARVEDPDVILLDIAASGLDGIAVCRSLKADERLRAIPVLFLTALGTDRASRLRALEAGAEGFLSKPFDEIELTAQSLAMAKIKTAHRLRQLDKAKLEALVVERTRALERVLARQQRTEEALREREMLLRESQVVAGLGSYVLDIPAGSWRSSEVLDKLFGIDEAHERTVAGWIALIHPDDRETMADYLRDEVLGQGRRFDKEYRIVRHDDQAGRWVHGLGRLESDARGRLLKMHGTIQDITDRRRAEDALRESEARYRTLFENSMDAVLLTVPDGHILSANPAACRMFGRGEEELRALGRGAIVDARDPRLTKLLEERARTGRASGELTMSRKDGSPFPGEVSSFLFTDTSGAMRTSMIIRDITDRKRAEEQTAGRARQQAAIAELGRLALTGVELQSVLDHAARSVARVLDVALCEVLELQPDRAAALLRAGVGWREGLVGRATVGSGAASQTGFTLHGKAPVIVADLRAEKRFSGSPLLREHGVVSGMSTVIGDPERPYGVLGAYARRPRTFTVHDQHFLQGMAHLLASAVRRGQAEQALRASEASYRRLYESMMDSFVETTMTGEIVLTNASYLALLGYSADEVKKLRHQDLTPARWHSFESGIVETQVLPRGYSDVYEKEYIRKDGTVFPVELRTFLLRDATGRPAGTWAIVRDVTERKRLAEEKARLEDQLRQAQKVEAIGRLAGGVAHDFNNLTAIVLGYGEMLLGQLSPEDPARKSVEQILEAGRRSAALTRQLLAFSRKQTLQPEVLDLNALLHNLEKMLGRLIGEDIRLEFKLAAGLGRVTADPGQIEQVVVNLVVNARDAMPRGGRLTVETADVELDETSAPHHPGVVRGSYVLLTLADTGCGMDKAAMARLFEPFFTTKEKGKGTGLGLAMVYGIVKQSDGYIWATSEPGQGTTFKVYLPRTDAEAQAKTVEAGGAAPRGGGELILLVEDEAALRGLCECALSDLGYRVSTAASGEEALALVEDERLEPDLVVTDVVMPGMSGAEMAERLRADRPGLRVIYMSGYPDDAIAQHGVLGQNTPFMQKPFTVRSLALKLREALAAKPAAARPGRRVLMIDDDEQYRELVELFCAKRGHVFAGVGSAATALASLAAQPCDVLLVDMNIPGTSGERILREIRAAGHAAPAIALTGNVDAADMDVLGPLGAVRALEKSGSAAPLLQAIEAVALLADVPGGAAGD